MRRERDREIERLCVEGVRVRGSLVARWLRARDSLCLCVCVVSVVACFILMHRVRSWADVT